jgi:hypothetical protein
MLNQRFTGLGRIAGALFVATLFAGAATVATAPAANAQTHHQFRGHPGFRGHAGFVGPGRFHGRFFPGRRFVGTGPFFGWYPPYNDVRYYYPQYFYPRYVMPTAVYLAPPPAPRAAMAHEREFTVYFDFDHYNLSEDARRVVDAAIVAAKAGGPARVAVIGNTDLAGTNSYNQVLSDRRAETVRRYMIDHGVDAGEINIRALGKSDPAVRTADGVREPRHRRVEIVITHRHNAPPATSMARPPLHPAAATIPPPPPPPPPGQPPVGEPTHLTN